MHIDIIDSKDTISRGNYRKTPYSETNTCDFIRENGKKCENKLTPAYKEYEQGKWTGKWLCREHWRKNDYNKRPDNYNNNIKEMRPCRNKIIDLSDLSNITDQDLGHIGEEIGCRTLKIKNRNIEEDNYGGNQYTEGHSDTLKHMIYGFIEIKTATFDPNRFGTTKGAWGASLGMGRECDNILVICMDENRNRVKRTYMIPFIEVFGQTNITINVNGTRYEKFRIDEKPYDETWQNMKKERYLNLNSTRRNYRK